MDYLAVGRGRRLSLALLAGALLIGGAPAQAQSPASDWRQTVFLYGMGAMIEGDAQVGGRVLFLLGVTVSRSSAGEII